MVISDRAAGLDEFTAMLQRAIACVSRSVLVQARGSLTAPFHLSFPHRFIPLQGRHRVALSVLHAFVLRERDEAPSSLVVRSAGYWYQFRERDGAEVIAFHWHPTGRGQVPFAHLHLAGRAGTINIDRRRHIPTGRVSLEAVVRFAIEELGVRPLRTDWQRVIEAGIQDFDAGRSW